MSRSNRVSASQLVQLFRSTLADLGHKPSCEAVESAAFLVYRAMTGISRDYHGVGHVFDVASGLPPLGRLAAIYHDTVYQHVDHGLGPEIQAKLAGVCQSREETSAVLASDLDEPTADVAAIFGFAPGQTVETRAGLNEFLSAVLAVRELTPFVDRKEAWTIAACIEATVPFRCKDNQGASPAELLHKRLKRLAKTRKERFSDQEISEAVQLSVRVANSDVQSFAQEDVGSFLDDTWKLLPETNPELHSSGAYSIRKYREALFKTEAFLASLKPEVIFQRYQGAPSDRAFNLLCHRARSNLDKGCEYLRAKIVTTSILEALAELTGGDAPVSYLLGSAGYDEAIQPQDMIPAYDPMVLHVLRHGRSLQARFDKNRSPLSANLYLALGTEGVNAQAGRIKLVHSKRQDWRWFLEGLPQDLVSMIARAVAEVAVERRDKLLRIADSGRKVRKAA